jgi:hypothetical protein
METTTVVLESTLKPSRVLRCDVTNPNYPFDQEIVNRLSAESRLEEDLLDQSNLSQNVAHNISTILQATTVTLMRRFLLVSRFHLLATD